MDLFALAPFGTILFCGFIVLLIVVTNSDATIAYIAAAVIVSLVVSMVLTRFFSKPLARYIDHSTTPNNTSTTPNTSFKCLNTIPASLDKADNECKETYNDAPRAYYHSKRNAVCCKQPQAMTGQLGGLTTTYPKSPKKWYNLWATLFPPPQDFNRDRSRQKLADHIKLEKLNKQAGWTN